MTFVMELHGKLSFTRTDSIGKPGYFGSIFRGKFENITEVAIKRILKSEYKVELEVLHKTQTHSNILRYYCSEEDVEYMFIATEMSSGSLKNLIRGEYNGPLFLDYQKIFRQITSGLAHLHEKKIVHRHLKPANILISCPDGSTVSPVIKLANFGITRKVQTEGPISLWKIAGSKSWLGPEVYQATAFKVEMDLFSLGCVMAFSLSGGKHPYGPVKEQRILNIWTKQEIVITVHDLKPVGGASAEEMLSLLNSLMNANTDARPSASEVLSHVALRKDQVNVAVSPVPIPQDQSPVVSPKQVKRENQGDDITIDSPLTKKAKPSGATAVEKDSIDAIASSSSGFTANDSGVETSDLFGDESPMNGFKTPSPLRSPLAYSRGRLASRSRPFSIQARGSSHLTSPRSPHQEDSRSCTTPRERASRGRGFSRGPTKPRSYHSEFTETDQMPTTSSMADNQEIKKETKVTFKDLDGKSDFNEEPAKRVQPRRNKSRDKSEKEKELLELCKLSSLDKEQYKRFCKLVSDEQINVNCTTPEGLTPLLLLTWKHYGDSLYKCLEALLKRKDVNVNASDRNGEWNALMYACRHYPGRKLFNIVSLLLGRGIEVTNVSTNALILLCKNYKNEDVLFKLTQLLLSRGIDLKTTDGVTGENALFALCYNYSGDNLFEITRLLIKAKVEVNSKNKYGWNSLLALVEMQHNHRDLLKMVKLLIEHKIDVNVCDEKGMNSLISLCENYHKGDLLEIFNLLIENGMKINASNYCGWNALFMLCYLHKESDLMDLIQRLLDAGINVNSKTEDNWNCLMALSDQQVNHQDFISILKLLIQRGADVNTKDDKGRNVLHFICAGKYKGDLLVEIIRLFNEHGIQLNALDEEGKNILHILCESCKLKNLKEIIQSLRDLNIDCVALDKKGLKPIDYLRFRKDVENKELFSN